MKSRMTMLGVFLFVAQLAACGGGGGGGGGDSPETSPEWIDVSRPAVIATTPAHDSLEVETNRAITATFSEAIDPETINARTFVMVDNATGTAVTGSVTYDEPSRTAIFRAGNLSPQTTYAATITDAVEDLAGNPLADPYAWQLTTGGVLDPGTTPPTVQYKPDTTPPTVKSTFPAPNALAGAPNAVVSVTFSEPIDPVTINAQSVTLSKDGTTPVAGTVTYIGTTALFTPTAQLSAGAVYTAAVATGVKDLAGNALAAPSVWNFTTGSQADVTGPHVLSAAPPDGALDVPIEAPLVVTFGEAIKPFEFGQIDGRPVAVTFNATYTTVTMTPTAGLRPGLTYTASILVPDQAGNPMETAYVWKFSTRP